MKLRLLMARRNRPGSWLIRLFCWSRVSHVAIMDGEDVIEASTSGVRVTDLESWCDEWPDFEMAHVSVPDVETGLAFARAQVGRPYDWGAILGFAFRRGWAERDKWMCSELVAATLMAAGRPVFRIDLARVTPGHIHMLNLG